MAAIASHGRALCRLNLCELLEIRDEQILQLATNCKNLEFLACQGCLSVSTLVMQEAANLLKMAQLAPSGVVLVPRSRIEIRCLQKRQREGRAAKLMQDLVCVFSVRTVTL